MEDNENGENGATSSKYVEGANSDDLTSKELTERIKSLEAQNQQMQNEFNVQRAKLKELFLQKETEHLKCMEKKKELQQELDELRSQFVVADLKSENIMQLKDVNTQNEITSLQQIVQDTIEESTICKAELERSKEETNRLWEENFELRELQQKHDSTGLAPHVMNLKKSIARKLGGDFFVTSDESIKAQTDNQCDHEDAEVLQAVVVQLQEEMKVLKEKIREADEIMNTNSTIAKQNLNTNATIEDKPATTCGTCQIHDLKVQELLKSSAEDKETISVLQKNLAESHEDLQKEAVLRKDLDNQWQKKREAHKMTVQLLREQVSSIEQQMLNLQQKYLGTKEDILRQLQQIVDERERCNKQLETLQADNDFLSGRYLKTAEEIENQYINLPNTIVELQELILRQQNELIQARVGSEFANQKCVTSLDEIQLLRDQLDAMNADQRTYKKKVKTELKSLQDRLTEHMLIQQNYETSRSSLERKEAELNRQISDFRVEIIELQDTNEKLSKMNGDYKAKIKNLQEDLATSEHVQNDFVKLSQKLQITLESLRHADTEVRWQDEEDVDMCSSCKLHFTVTVRKRHCRHCGHIFCDNCLTKTVNSGPRKRLARVCDICHTLLTPNTAPYFSQEQSQ